MTITRVGIDSTVATANNQTNKSLVCSHASTPQPGDVVLIEATLIAPGTGTTNDFDAVSTTGWTLVGTAFDAGTTSLRSSVYRKVWAATDNLPILSWPLAASAVAIIKIRRGVDNTTPIVSPSSVAVHGGSSTARTTTSITTTENSVIEYGFADRSGSTFTKGTTTDDSLAVITLSASISAASFGIPGVSPPTAYVRTATASVGTSVGASWIYGLKPAPATSSPPTVDAGADMTVDPNLVDSFTLTAIATDSDGTIASYLWEDITAAAVTIPGSAAARIIAVVRKTTTTTKTYRVTVTDNSGLTATDTVAVTFLPHTRWRKTLSTLIPLRRV